MPSFSDRLLAIKVKQEVSDLKKKEEAEKAQDTVRLELEAKRSELSVERDAVMVEFAEAEKTANEAKEAIAQADVFAEQQGENLDPKAKAEIDAMKGEAGEAQRKFQELELKLKTLKEEIEEFEKSEQPPETLEAVEIKEPNQVEVVMSPEERKLKIENLKAELEKLQKFKDKVEAIKNYIVQVKETAAAAREIRRERYKKDKKVVYLPDDWDKDYQGGGWGEDIKQKYENIKKEGKALGFKPREYYDSDHDIDSDPYYGISSEKGSVGMLAIFGHDVFDRVKSIELELAGLEKQE
jgi:chromosome segregation ATPase